MSDKQELSMEDMGQVAGGWEFHTEGSSRTGKIVWIEEQGSLDGFYGIRPETNLLKCNRALEE